MSDPKLARDRNNSPKRPNEQQRNPGQGQGRQEYGNNRPGQTREQPQRDRNR